MRSANTEERKIVQCGIVKLSDYQEMKQMEEGGHKYVGILEGDQIMENEMKEIFRKEYTRRMKLVLKSKLNGRNKILAINMWAVSLLRYSRGIIRCNKNKLLDVDRRTRKLMTMNGELHPKSDVNRIYVPRRKSGHGLISVESCIPREENSIGWYMK